MTKDFTPTKEQISLHGLGFIQVKLPANRRLHVWHPHLPRRRCFEASSIHNHRFSFRSTVLVGEQVNRRYVVVECPPHVCSHDRISHDGPRSEKGGRLSFVDGYVFAQALTDERYQAGNSYEMAALEYHETPNDGIVVTLMEKLSEGTVHASSLIRSSQTFDQDFDRFQLDEATLWSIVVDALRSGA